MGGDVGLMHPTFNWLALIEKRLPLAERQRAEAHLAACPACRAEFAALADVAQTLTQLPAALTLPPRRAVWSAQWAKARRPPRAYPLRQIAMAFSLAIIVGLFAQRWPAQLTGQTPTLGLARPYSVAQTQETPRPPGSSTVHTSTTQPAATRAPRLSPEATPVPGPRS